MSSDDESIVGGGSGGLGIESAVTCAMRERRKIKDPCRIYILVEKGVGGLWSGAFPDEKAAGEEGKDCVRGMVVVNQRRRFGFGLTDHISVARALSELGLERITPSLGARLLGV